MIKNSKISISLLVIFFLTFYIQAQNCICGNSIPQPPPKTGQSESQEIRPSYNAVFKNGKEIILCEYGANYNGKDEFYSSEFAVYNCDNIEIDFGFYSAIDYCRINFKNDTLKITELKELAVKENWETELVDYKTKYFYYKKDSLVVEEKITIPKFHIDSKKIEEFHKFIEKPEKIDFRDTGFGTETVNGYYDILKKLEILSIYGDNKAKIILKNFPEIFGFNPNLCCELAEKYSSAIEIINNIEKLSTKKYKKH